MIKDITVLSPERKKKLIKAYFLVLLTSIFHVISYLLEQIEHQRFFARFSLKNSGSRKKNIRTFN